jgi:hypothetical protein
MLAPIPTNAAVPSTLCWFRHIRWFVVHSDVGIYETDGTVKDEDVFATTVADEAALTDVRFEAA